MRALREPSGVNERGNVLRRTKTLLPLRKPDEANRNFYINIKLVGSDGRVWKVRGDCPNENSHRWEVVTGTTIDNIGHEAFWVMVKNTVNILLKDSGKELRAIPEDDKHRYIQFVEFAARHHTYTDLPPFHSSIGIRLEMGSDIVQNYVLGFLENEELATTLYGIVVVCPKGIVSTVCVNQTEKYDSIEQLRMTAQPGWAVFSYGGANEPQKVQICQDVREGSTVNIKCPLCPRKLVSPHEAREHVNSQHAGQLSSQILANELLEWGESVACPHCLKLFSRKGGVANHARTCPDRPIVCALKECNQTMAGKGHVAHHHLKEHYIERHRAPQDGSLFSEGTIEAISEHSFLTICGCEKHSADRRSTDRLLATREVPQHKGRDKQMKAQFGESADWKEGFRFMATKILALDPNHDTYEPLILASRGNGFEYYKHKFAHSKALSTYSAILDTLEALEPSDKSDEAMGWWFLALFADTLMYNGDDDLRSKNSSLVRRTVDKRAGLLANGKIEELWTTTFARSEQKSGSKKIDENMKRRMRITKLMRDQRFSSAADAATSKLKRREMDEAGVQEFRKAVNPSCIRDEHIPGIIRRSARKRAQIDDTLFDPPPIDEEDEEGARKPKIDPGLLRLRESILHTDKGKAAGFVGDSIDFFRLFAMTSGKKGEGLASLLEIVRRTIRGHMPLPIRHAYNTIVGCLFVKPDIKPEAYRPIGIPTALYRVIGKYFCREVAKEMAVFLLEYNQFAIGVPAGMSILLGSLQLLVQQHIYLEESDEARTAKRLAISLDLTSMFNALNLDVFFNECDKEDALRKYIPFFETCFMESTTYVLQKSDGSVSAVRQDQGGAQGSNMVPMVAAILVRRAIKSYMEETQPAHLTPPTSESIESIIIPITEDGSPRSVDDIQTDEKAKASYRNQHERFVETEKGEIDAFMDDMTGVIPYTVAVTFIRYMKEKGHLVGAYLNAKKTQVLLGLNWDKEWRDQRLDGSIRTKVDIIEALQELGVPRENIITCAKDGPTSLAKTEGIIKVLGSAIGFESGINEHRLKVLRNQVESFEAIREFVSDHTFKYALTTLCILPKTIHMFDTAPSRNGVEHFASLCDESHMKFFSWLFLDGKPIDNETRQSYRLSTLLICQGGINFTTPKNNCLAIYTAKWARVLAAGKRSMEKKEPMGIRAANGDKIGVLPKSVQWIIDKELDNASLQCIKDFNSIATELCAKHKSIGQGVAQSKGVEGILLLGATPKFQHLLSEASTAHLAQDIYNELSETEESTGVASHLRAIMPSTTQCLASEYLSCLDMSESGKVSSRATLLYTRVKLALPIVGNLQIGERIKCPLCSQPDVITRYGDHIFSCSKTHSERTLALHNPTRDEWASALERLAAIGSGNAQFGNVQLERKGLIPGTARRPADIHITFDEPTTMVDDVGEKHEDIVHAAFDVTVAKHTPQKPTKGFENESIWPPEAYTHLVDAEERKRAYKNGGDTPNGTAAHLAERKTAFIPIAIDVYGGMSSSGSALLHGSLAQKKRPNPIKGFTVGDFECAKWITANRKPTDSTREFVPPFMPKQLCGQLKEASRKIKMDLEEETGQQYNHYWASTAERKILQSLSINHVEGVTAVIDFFLLASSGGEGLAIRERDFTKIRKQLKAAGEMRRDQLAKQREEKDDPPNRSSTQPDEEQSNESGSASNPRVGEEVVTDSSSIGSGSGLGSHRLLSVGERRLPISRASKQGASEMGVRETISFITRDSARSAEYTRIAARSAREGAPPSSSGNLKNQHEDESLAERGVEGGAFFEDFMEVDGTLGLSQIDLSRNSERAGSQQSNEERRSLSGEGPESLSRSQGRASFNN